jgi:hypothetical protein
VAPRQARDDRNAERPQMIEEHLAEGEFPVPLPGHALREFPEHDAADPVEVSPEA